MKTLVTGATGFLGAALVERLLLAGASLRLPVRAGSDRRRLDAVLARHAGAEVEIVEGSLDDVDAIGSLLNGVDRVHHLAAAKRGSSAEIARATLDTSRCLLQAIVASGRPIRVVLVSSFGVYGTASLAPGAEIDEDTPLEDQPGRRDAYSHAKLEQERLFRAWHARHGVPLAVVRPGVIHGPAEAEPSQRVGLRLPRGLFLFAGGDNALPLTYVDNCAEAIRVVGERARFDGDTYNIVDDTADGVPVSCRQWLARHREAGLRVRVLPIAWTTLERIARWGERFARVLRGRWRAPLTPYQIRAIWKPQRYARARVFTLGYHQPVPGDEALRRSFAAAAPDDPHRQGRG